MQDRTGFSPKALARIGGALYLIIIAIGIFGELGVRGRVVVAGDAVATAANLRSLESLWRLGIAAEWVLLVCAVTLAAILFVLLRQVSRDLAMLAIFFNLIAIAVEAASSLRLVEALHLTEPARVGLAIRSFSHGFTLGLLFFGCECLILGCLIYRSGFLPKTIGVLMVIAGACYLVNSFGHIVAPQLAARLVPAILLPPFVGESSLCLWLLIKGIDVGSWHAIGVRRAG